MILHRVHSGCDVGGALWLVGWDWGWRDLVGALLGLQYRPHGQVTHKIVLKVL